MAWNRRTVWRAVFASVFGVGFLALTLVLPLTTEVCSTDTTVTTTEKRTGPRPRTTERQESAQEVRDCAPFAPNSAAVLLTGLGTLLLAAPFVVGLIPPNLRIKWGELEISRESPTELLNQIDQELNAAPATETPPRGTSSAPGASAGQDAPSQ